MKLLTLYIVMVNTGHKPSTYGTQCHSRVVFACTWHWLASLVSKLLYHLGRDTYIIYDKSINDESGPLETEDNT